MGNRPLSAQNVNIWDFLITFFSFTPVLTFLFFGLPAYQATAASKMVKVEEAKPFIPVSLWDHTNPFLFSFHSKVVLHTAYHISIDVEWQFWFSAYLLSHQLYCLTHSGNAHFILSPSFNTLLFLQIFISYTSHPPFQPHIYFFSVADSWFQDFPSFQSLVGCFILIWTSLHRFSVCLRTLYLQCIGFGCPFGGHLLSWSAFTLLYCFKIELFCWFKALKKALQWCVGH